MVKLTDHGVVLAADGTFSSAEDAQKKTEGKAKTMAYGILKAHNHSNNMEQLQLKFDALVSPDSICGPCFGVTDIPANNQVSIRHMTRNYPNREGSKPGQGQMACACLMDARSIAATVRNGGKLTAATELNVEYRTLHHHFDPKIYENQVFDNYNKGDDSVELTMGPNIADWPEM